jgi:hypothetical protein
VAYYHINLVRRSCLLKIQYTLAWSASVYRDPLIPSAGNERSDEAQVSHCLALFQKLGCAGVDSPP